MVQAIPLQRLEREAPTTISQTPILTIRTPDGKSHSQPLPEEHLSVGRSSANDLCYPDDAGLSLMAQAAGW